MDPNEAGHLVEEKEATLIQSEGLPQLIQRKGLFLRSSQNIADRNQGEPFFPLMRRPCPDWVSKLNSNVSFKGWLNPRSGWQKWVEKLSPMCEEIWKKAGIFDAIQASTCTIKKDLTSIWEVLPYWSEETNTFVFPLGEATITLEDTMILGGFLPVGVCVRQVEALNEELEKFNIQLLKEHRAFNKTAAKKASFSAWMNHFMKCNDVSVEHIAFLTLWLSRHVFPKAPGNVIRKELFPMAIHMAQGERFALGPAVLSSLYRDMRLLKEHLTRSDKDDVLEIFAPFRIVQMWIWEHFVSTRQNARLQVIGYNKPRAARWHNVTIKRTPYSMCICHTLDDFQWRPYAKKLDNWSIPFYYKENGQWYFGNNDNDEPTILFAQCLRSGELVGLDNIELYLPRRVSRMFGYDQDLSGCIHVVARVSEWELAWANYKNYGMNYILYIPPRHSVSNVTYPYHSWWTENISSSTYSEIDIGMIEKFIEERRKCSTLSIFFRKKERELLDLNSTPLDEVPRCNIRIMKGIARTRRSSTTFLDEYQPPPFAAAHIAAGGGVRSQQGLEDTEDVPLDDEGANIPNFAADQEETCDSEQTADDVMVPMEYDD